MGELLEAVFGLSAGPEALTPSQSAARAAVVFCAGIALVRLGNKRFLGKNTPLDVLVAVMLGTVLARAINGSGRLGPTLAGAAALIALHYVFSALAFRFPLLDGWVKGHRRLLIQHGKPQEVAMRRTHLNQKDLEEILRLHGERPETQNIAEAYLERSGSVSVLKEKKRPEVIEVKVEAGVQTVKIELGGS